MYDLILYFRLNILLFLWAFFSIANMCILFTPFPKDIPNHPDLSPGTTHSPPSTSIIGGQESPGFFQVSIGFKSTWKEEETLCFRLIPGPLWLFVTFSITFNKLHYLPYYTHVSCLDASMWDTKNLRIFWSETTQAYNTTTDKTKTTFKTKLNTCVYH
jgi:hypothetical protein